jgi:hypothetical protein
MKPHPTRDDDDEGAAVVPVRTRCTVCAVRDAVVRSLSTNPTYLACSEPACMAEARARRNRRACGAKVRVYDGMRPLQTKGVRR